MNKTPPTQTAQTAQNAQKETLLTFPSQFPIKVMGQNVETFAQEIIELVQLHDSEFDALRIEYRESKGGNYMGLTVTVTALSQEHLDNIYRALTAHPLVKVVL